MHIGAARTMVDELSAKYARASQIIDEMVFNKLELLCASGAITSEGLARMVISANSRQIWTIIARRGDHHCAPL